MEKQIPEILYKYRCFNSRAISISSEISSLLIKTKQRNSGIRNNKRKIHYY